MRGCAGEAACRRLGRSLAAAALTLPGVLAGPACAAAEADAASPATTVAIGWGVVHAPRWPGARDSLSQPLPYLDVDWRDQVEFSTVKGLQADLIHGSQWHGGLLGTSEAGRSRARLGEAPWPAYARTYQAGLYLECEVEAGLTLGTELRHDLNGDGVGMGSLYGELDLPKLGYLEHDLHLSLDGLDHAGMQRAYGVAARTAALLQVPAYAPSAGLQRVALTYEGFLPTSPSTGLVFGLTVARLAGGPAASPIIRRDGARFQREALAAWVVHF